MNLSRLTDRFNPAAAKIALRAAIFMPLCLLLASEILGDEARPFAAFGSFVLLAMVTFAGRPVPRFFAWAGLVLVGCVFIVIGTLLSEYSILAALAAGVISFLVFFSGVVNQYFAAARNAAVLLIALPLMVEADSAAVDDRLAGWLLACLICIPATYLFWRLPWYGGLRKQAAAASRALAGLVRDPTSEVAGDQASREVWKLRKLFLSTPNRPTGASGVSAAIANLVDEQAWTYGLVVNPGGGIISDRPYARDLRGTTADLLDATADLLLDPKDQISVESTDRALRKLIDQNTADLRQEAEASGHGGDADTIKHLDHEFRLRKLAYSAIDIAETAEIASGTSVAPGALGHLWS